MEKRILHSTGVLCLGRGRASVQSLGPGGDAEVWSGDEDEHMGLIVYTTGMLILLSIDGARMGNSVIQVCINT